MTMFKSKHSGWTWDLKRTPFGGGGSWNPITAVTDFVSSPIQSIEDLVSNAGNDVGKGINAVGDAFAPVLEPVYQPIGSGVEQAGQGVKQGVTGAIDSTAGWDPHITEGTGDWLTENGWMIPLAMISYGAGAALGGGVAAGEVVGEGAVAGAGGATAADGTIFAAGEAIPAGTTMSGGSLAGSGAGVGMVDASGNIIGAGSEGASMGVGANAAGQAAYDAALANGASQSAAQAAADSAYNSYLTLGGPGNAAGLTAGEDLAQLMQTYPDLSQAQLENIMQINYGTDPMLSADAANLAAEGYNADAINQVLGYSYSNPELAGTGIESSAANSASGLNLSDSLKTAKRANDVAKLLKQGAASGLTSSLGKLAQGSTPFGAQQLQIVRGNQNPFTYTQQQPIQDTRQAQLAKLLQQG